MRIFVGFGLLVIVVLGLTLQRWVVRPLSRLAESLATSTVGPIEGLRSDRTEFGRLAQLAECAYAQRAALEHEIDERRRVEGALRESEATLRHAIDERVRLGRDLHDSVIQAIYASGLGLATVRTLLRTDPVEADRRLEQVRQTLNETIRDLRNFITGLEPEALRRMTLTESVHALIDLLETASPIEAALDIDEKVVETLAPTVRANLLQIVREAVSNVLWHGAATVIHVALVADDGRATLVVADNGRGFDPPTVDGRGRGLSNMVERAQAAGASFHLEAAPGKGTRVIVSFPVTAPSTHP